MKRIICLLGAALMVLTFVPAIYADDATQATETTTATGEINASWVQGSFGQAFCGRTDNTRTFNIYKDTNSKSTYLIQVADYDTPGQKFKVIARTTKGDTINYIFKSKGSGHSNCNTIPNGAYWPGYRSIYSLPISNAGYFKLAKVKRISPSSGGWYYWLAFRGNNYQGWRQTSGSSCCGW